MRMLLPLLLLSWTLGATAEQTTYNRVSLSEEASAELENDLIVAILYAQAEGENAAGLADTVNQAIARGVERARAVAGVEVGTQGYHTEPIYQKSRVIAWRVRQELRLQSGDTGALGRLIGDLQASGLRVSSLGYRLSPEKRRAQLDRITDTALNRFSARAHRIARTLGHKGYRLVRLSVNDGGSAPPVVFRRAMRAGADTQPVGPVTLEGGKTRLSVTISGEIELTDD